MTNVAEIPLQADNQTFGITIAGRDYRMRLLWRGQYWCLDIHDVRDNAIVSGLPLVTGGDLLAPFRALCSDFSLYVVCDDSLQAGPSQTDLGTGSHLYVVTEPL